MSNMRVLMQIREDYEDKSGGDSIQLIQTKASLEKLGVKIDVSTELEPSLDQYDLVHLFNLTRIQETLFQARNARAYGKPIILSTIYWPFKEFSSLGCRGMQGFLGKVLSADSYERAKAVAKFVIRKERSKASRYLIAHNYSDMQKEVVRLSDICLPNAETEMRVLLETLNCDTPPYVVVPNAVDMEAIYCADKANVSGYPSYDLICVGRIEPRKNQLNLLRAVADSGYSLALVGKCATGQRSYFNLVMKEVNRNKNVTYIEAIPNYELYKMYKTCRISVLPSWFETPGLVSLEAAAMGCAVVVSPKGTTRDYFGNEAFYCDVTSPESIRTAVDKAYEKGGSEKLKQLVRDNFTWEKTAARTLEAYGMAIRTAKSKE